MAPYYTVPPAGEIRSAQKDPIPMMKIPFCLAAALGGAVLFFNGAAAQAAPAAFAVPVETARVEEREVAERYEITALTRAWRTSAVAAGEEGLVQRVLLEEGNALRAGATLAVLDGRDVEIELTAARAGLGEQRALADQAGEKLARAEKLFSGNSLAEEEYRDHLHRRKILEQQIQRAQAQIALLEERLSKKTVRAPFDGILARKLVEEGQWLQRGGTVGEIADISSLEVIAEVPELLVPRLRRDSPVEVRADALAGACAARLLAVLPRGTPGARTLAVRLRLDNPDSPRGRLLPGMTVRLAFELEPLRKSLLVPKDAVNLQGAARAVMAVVDGKAVRVEVAVQGQHGNMTAIEGALKSGDEVVVRGNEMLQPGMAVRVLGGEGK